MRARSLICVLAPMVAVALSAGPAQAVDRKSQAAADQAHALGARQMAEGRFEEAAAAFMEAYRRAANPSELFNAGQAMLAGENYHQARIYLRMYGELPETDRIAQQHRDKAKLLIAECEAHLCSIDVQGADSAQLGGEAVEGRVWVPPGVHTLSMQGSGGRQSVEISCTKNERRTVVYRGTVPTKQGAEPSVGLTAGQEASEQPAMPPPSQERWQPARGRWVAVGVTAGVGAALLGAGLATYLVGAGARGDAADTTRPFAEQQDLRARANDMRMLSLVTTYAGIGVMVGAALPLVLWPKRKVPAHGFQVRPTLGAQQLGLAGTF